MAVDMRQGKISTRLLLAWLLVLVWLPILAAAQEVSLTLLHTNDTPAVTPFVQLSDDRPGGHG